MTAICLKDEPWDFDKARRMEKPWEYWNNDYTRFRKLQWEIQQKAQKLS